MAKKKSFTIGASLQQALGDTVIAAKNHSGDLHVEVIPLRKIELDPDNPREIMLTLNDLQEGFSAQDDCYEQKQAELAALQTLAHSIKEQGVINPILVYKQGEKYRLIAGERRTLASCIAKKEDIQAKVIDKKPDPLKLSLLQWIENIERTDLSLGERLRNLEKMLAAYAAAKKISVNDITATELCQLLGCSLQHAVNYKNVLEATPNLYTLIQNNQIRNLEKAAYIAKAPLLRQDTLITACLAGSTLKSLKQLANAKDQVTVSAPIQAQLGRGRQATRVNFGSTNSMQIARLVINALLDHAEGQHLRQQLGKVEWLDYKSISTAFQRLIKLLEHDK